METLKELFDPSTSTPPIDQLVHAYANEALRPQLSERLEGDQDFNHPSSAQRFTAARRLLARRKETKQNGEGHVPLPSPDDVD